MNVIKILLMFSQIERIYHQGLKISVGLFQMGFPPEATLCFYVFLHSQWQ